LLPVAVTGLMTGIRYLPGQASEGLSLGQV
jgi:hypothetical protein